MTSTERCASCNHTGHFHKPRSCRAYVNAPGGLVPCICKGFQPVTESEARLLDGNR